MALQKIALQAVDATMPQAVAAFAANVRADEVPRAFVEGIESYSLQYCMCNCRRLPSNSASNPDASVVTNAVFPFSFIHNLNQATQLANFIVQNK